MSTKPGRGANGTPYHGQIRGWGHRLIDLGHRVVSVGKLHLRSSEDANGFDEEIVPMHVLDGIGDLHGMVRTPPPMRPGIRLLAEKVYAGESSYTVYDTEITEKGVRVDSRRWSGNRKTLGTVRFLRASTLPPDRAPNGSCGITWMPIFPRRSDPHPIIR